MRTRSISEDTQVSSGAAEKQALQRLAIKQGKEWMKDWPKALADFSC
jgi:hypothetical protein